MKRSPDTPVADGLRMPRMLRAIGGMVVLAVALVAGLVLCGLWLVGFPEVAASRLLSLTNLFDLLKLAFAVVAGIGGVVALVVAYRRQRVAEAADGRDAERLLHERFQKASEQLGNEATASLFRGAHFDGGEVVFTGAEFTSERASFGEVRFDGARFADGTVSFGEARFTGGIVTFCNADFAGARVTFHDTEFSGGEIHFSDAHFTAGSVSFADAKFHGSHVGFDNVKLRGGTVDLSKAERWDVPPAFSQRSDAAGLRLPEAPVS